MSKNYNYIILGLITLAFIFRMLLEQYQLKWFLTGSYLSLFVIISSYYGIYSQRQNSNEKFDFMMDLKGGAQGGAFFAIGTGIMTYVFYKLIHPSYLQDFDINRREEILAALIENGKSTEVISKIMTNHENMGALILVPGNWSILTMATLTFLAIFYSFIFSLITKFLPKFVNQ